MSKKGENIYKRKDGRWEARYVKSHRPDGMPKYGYCYGKSYREAKDKVAAAKAALIAGNQLPVAAQKRRFDFYCDEWLTLSRCRVKESTYAKYNGILEKYIKPCLGGCPVQTLSSVTIEQFSHDLLFEEKLSPKTVKDILTILHSIMKYTGKQVPGALSFTDVVYPKIPKKEMRVLSREEQTRFVRYLLDEPDAYKFGVLLALFSGMRIGEVCALRWKDVSLSERVISVKHTMQRLQDLSKDHVHKTKVVIGDPKSNTSARMIPMTDCLVRLCQSRKCRDPEAFILTGDAERYIEPRAMQYRLARYTADCGLEGVHFHTLRHTFATRCVEVDFEIKSLSEILGHANPRITLERYVHSSIELKRDNMNKLAAIGF